MKKLRGKNLKDAAASCNLNYMSLSRYIKKKEAFQANPEGDVPSMGYTMPTIFTEEEENILSDYLLTCAASNYGLTMKETRVIAYKLAKIYNKKVPESWDNNEKAGEVWLKLFMQRHPNDEVRAITPGTSADQSMPSSNSSVVNNNANEPVASTSTAHTPVLNDIAIEPIASTSTAPSPLATISNVFSPESVFPLPKGPPRKNRQRNRRKIKSAVLTDTPTKDVIAAIEANRKSENVKKRIFSEGKKKSKTAKKTYKNRLTSGDEEEAENNCFCLVCLDAYANSRSNEQWVQCLVCKGWAHVVALETSGITFAIIVNLIKLRFWTDYNNND